MSDKIRVSQSRVNSYRLCHRKHWYQYVLGLKKKRKARPLAFGSIIHSMLEHHANGRDPFKYLDNVAANNRKLFAEEIEEYGDIIGDARLIMTAYFEFWKKNKRDELVPLKIKKQKAEHRFLVDAGEFNITGVIDMIAAFRSHDVLVEHKTGGQFPNADHRWRNLQSALYIRIIDMLGMPAVDGTLWDFVRSKSPTRPQVLKDGSLSERSIDTLPSVVREVIRENKIKTNHDAFIKTVNGKLPYWFERIYTPIKPKVVNQVWSDFVATATSIVHDGDKTKDRNFGRHCEWCNFEPLCRASLQGNNEQIVIQREFTTHGETDDQTEFHE